MAEQPMQVKRFSSSVAAALGINDLKFLVAVKSDGTEEVFVPEGARVVEVPGQRPRPRSAGDLPQEAGPNDVYLYTYEDGKWGACVPSGGGGVICRP